MLAEPFREVTRSPEADQSESGETSASTVAGITVGATIGVIIIVIVIVSIRVWCIIRYNKERQKSVTNKQQKKHQDEKSDGESTNATVLSIPQHEDYLETRVYHRATSIGIAEQDMQLNQAYGVIDKGRVGLDAEKTEDDYEKMYDAQRLDEYYGNTNEYELSPLYQEGNVDVHVHTENTDEIYGIFNFNP